MSAFSNVSLRKACACSLGLLLVDGGAALAQEQRGGIIEEIVVTAQKREESLQDVPVSISVVGDQQLEDYHVTQLTDIAAYVPGLQVNSGGSPGQTSLSLRGLAQVGPGQTVGTYLDDAPVGSTSFYARGSAFALDLLPYDIERLEVLRGPQGTLYGASTIGGLLKYVTRAPDLSKFEFRAGADVFNVADGSDLGVGGRVGLNAPLVDGKAAIRASYAYQRTPGFIDNPTMGRDDQNEYKQDGGRIALLWQASDTFSLEVTGLWQSVDSDNNGTEVSSLPPTIVPLGGGRTNNNVMAEPFSKDIAYYAATLKGDLGWADFVSATSYSSTKTDQFVDATRTYGIFFDLVVGIPNAQSAFVLGLELDKLTQEFRLASNTDGPLEWLVGAFYTDEDSKNFQLVTGQLPDGSPIAGLNPLAKLALPTGYKEYAGFADLTYKFTQRFDFTVGARWAHNDQDFNEINEPGPLLPGGEFPGESSEDVFTYMLSPRFHVSDDTMVYARVASGYRPGGPNVPLLGADPTVDSDSLVNYELGLKTELYDHRAYFDLAAFYMDWTDIQVTVAQNGVSWLANAGKAKSQGFELSSAFSPTNGLRLGVNLAYTDSSLTEDVPPPGPGLAGDRLSNIPKWSGSLTGDYSFPAGNWTARVGGGYRYVGSRLSALESDPDVITADSYSALDLNASVASDRWSLRLFVRNVTDEHADLTNVLNTNALGAREQVSASILQPRTIGLALDVTF